MNRTMATIAVFATALALLLGGPAFQAAAGTGDDPAVQPFEHMLQQRIQAMEAVQQHMKDPAQVQRIVALLQEARADLDALQGEASGPGLQNALEKLQRNADRQQQRLTDLLAKAPAAAQAGLQRAITACQTLRTTAMQHLETLAQTHVSPAPMRPDVMRPSDMRPPGAGRPDSVPAMGRGPHGPGGMGMGRGPVR